MSGEQGISKPGNPRLRTAMVELAWLWLRQQPGTALSRWSTSACAPSVAAVAASPSRRSLASSSLPYGGS